ncbi:MAG: hypothetical protein HY899_01500 [Deltaproteobacteria bacterium]|nr:hypothetical protein [Deltaproteobacteria bacterium]
MSGQGNCKKQGIITPRDPNQKTGPDGDLIEGQTLTYSIDYENTGEGTACGVFIKDTVDQNPDETTLLVNDCGMYFAPLRTSYRYVGTATVALSPQYGGRKSALLSIPFRFRPTTATLIQSRSRRKESASWPVADIRSRARARSVPTSCVAARASAPGTAEC